MNTFTTTIDENGVIIFPKKFCDEQDWKEGDVLNFKVDGESILIQNTTAKSRKENHLRMVVVKNVTYSHYVVEVNNKEQVLSNFDEINCANPLKVERGSDILVSNTPTTSEEIMNTLKEGHNQYTWIGSTLEDCVLKL